MLENRHGSPRHDAIGGRERAFVQFVNLTKENQTYLQSLAELETVP
jgi:hypothetical protein